MISDHPQRLHYLDWIRVLAVFGVFVFHALHAFDGIPWFIKNEEVSFAITGFLMLFFPWGLPLFFMVAGASTYFALRKRDNRAFVQERVNRLFLPFVIGSIILSPIQAYTVALHRGLFEGSFIEFVLSLPGRFVFMFSPKMFSILGWHLWFLGFLFSFALVALPLFRYLSQNDGGIVDAVAGFAERVRGGIFVLLIPLWLARVGMHGLFPLEHGWTDFTYYLLFYIYGFIFFYDPRFLTAIRRDWPFGLVIGLMGVIMIGVGTGTGFIGENAWEPVDGYTLGSIALNTAQPAAALGWGLAVLRLAQWRFNFSNAFLRYGQRILVPFYVLHQPIIFVLLLYIVPWSAELSTKIWTTFGVSLALTLLIYHLLIRPIRPARAAFGMKAQPA